MRITGKQIYSFRRFRGKKVSKDKSTNKGRGIPKEIKSNEGRTPLARKWHDPPSIIIMFT